VVFGTQERSDSRCELRRKSGQRIEYHTTNREVCAHRCPAPELLCVPVVLQRQRRSHRAVLTLLLDPQPPGRRVFPPRIDAAADQSDGWVCEGVANGRQPIVCHQHVIVGESENVSTGPGNPSRECRAFSGPRLIKRYKADREAARGLRGHVCGPVAASIIHDDYFVARFVALVAKLFECLVEERRPVMRGDNHTDARPLDRSTI
jgi:hypothetical protein